MIPHGCWTLNHSSTLELWRFLKLCSASYLNKVCNHLGEYTWGLPGTAFALNAICFWNSLRNHIFWYYFFLTKKYSFLKKKHWKTLKISRKQISCNPTTLAEFCCIKLFVFIICTNDIKFTPHIHRNKTLFIKSVNVMLPKNITVTWKYGYW